MATKITGSNKVRVFIDGKELPPKYATEEEREKYSEEDKGFVSGKKVFAVKSIKFNGVELKGFGPDVQISFNNAPEAKLAVAPEFHSGEGGSKPTSALQFIAKQGKSRPARKPAHVPFQPMAGDPSLRKLSAKLRYEKKIEDAKRRAKELSEEPSLDLRSKYSRLPRVKGK